MGGRGEWVYVLGAASGASDASSRQPHVRAVALLKASVAPLLLLLVDILLVMLVLVTNQLRSVPVH